LLFVPMTFPYLNMLVINTWQLTTVALMHARLAPFTVPKSRLAEHLLIWLPSVRCGGRGTQLNSRGQSSGASNEHPWMVRTPQEGLIQHNRIATTLR
jgi:hypothetical protein